MQVYCVSCTADSPARAIMQNMAQYNGYYGCGWCLHQGLDMVLPTVTGTIKYPVGGAVEERTSQQTLRMMAEAAASSKAVQGVKGPSALINLQHFDIVWSFTPDYMHCVLLGVTRQLTELWLASVGEPFYIGSPDDLYGLDERLLSIKPPLCFPRLPRSLLQRKYWKATEWQQWLLFFSLPCVVGILPAKYSRHYSLLVRGIALLLKDTVSDDDITESTKCIVRFVVGVQFLYDEAEMTFNMHQLLHLPKSAALQGPLWAHSCFMFESNIGQVKKLVTSAHGVSQQIVERLMMTANLENLKALASTQTQELLSKSPTTTKQAVVPLGKARPVSAALLAWVHEEMGDIIAGPVVEHDRVAMSGFVFHSEQYKRPYKTDSTVLLMSGTFVKAETLLSATDHFGNKKVFAVSQNWDQFIPSPLPVGPSWHQFIPN
ncbi:uncharacterized protein LOC144177757 [Haemaphysalis longicornis]